MVSLLGVGVTPPDGQRCRRFVASSLPVQDQRPASGSVRGVLDRWADFVKLGPQDGLGIYLYLQTIRRPIWAVYASHTAGYYDTI